MNRLAAAAAAILALAPAAEADPPAPETLTLSTPRAVPISVLVDGPAGEAPFPTLVIAPGAAYPATAPLHAELAAAATRAGFLVYRFDWAYWTAGTPPSADLSDEHEDLRTVLARVRDDPRADPERIVLAGKSLGSLVAWDIFREDTDLQTLVLLTPLCARLARPDVKEDEDEEDHDVVERGTADADDDTDNDGQADNGADETPPVKQNYPGLGRSDRPVVLAIPDADPACPESSLEEVFEGGPHNVTLLRLRGDHRLEVGDAQENRDNVRSAAAMIVRVLTVP